MYNLPEHPFVSVEVERINNMLSKEMGKVMTVRVRFKIIISKGVPYHTVMAKSSCK